VFFWSGVVGVGCWFLVALLEAGSQWSRDSQARRRLGAEARPGESAYEERLRLRAAEGEAGDARGARP